MLGLPGAYHNDVLDALIIGAGPAGSTLATLLAGSGWTVGLAEAATFPRRKVCGEYLSPTNYSLFQRLGFEERFFELAGPEIRRVGIFSDGIALISPFPENKKLPQPWGRALRREVLDVELLKLALATGSQLWQPYSAIGVSRSPEGFVTTLKSSTSEILDIESRLVVAAHGSWKIGPLPTQQKRRAPTPHDLFGFKAHFKNAQLPPDLMPMIVFPGGYGGMVTTDEGFTSISACVEKSTIERLRKDARANEIGPLFEQHLLSNIEQLNVILGGSRRVGKWLTAGVVMPEAHTRSREGILAVGNAAGESHPIVAEGISMAIQGAGLLYSVLETCDPKAINEASRDFIAKEYDRRWKRTFARRIHFASAAATAAMSHRSRPLLAAILRKFPSLLTTGTRMSGKVWPMS